MKQNNVAEDVIEMDLVKTHDDGISNNIAIEQEMEHMSKHFY